ncbi:MAG TPA: GGDEF domain-containing protein [Gemmatimonadales bacterium]|nr:GGDEF domain-containing protein [Gemmatimonadales bacterium]
MLDLVRQAYGASVGWAIGTSEGPFDTPTIHDPAELEQRRRGAALVQLASVDGRLHVVRDPDVTYVAVGDFPYGVGLSLRGALLDDVSVDALAAALRRFVAGMRIAEEQSTAPRARIVAGKIARLAAGAVTLEGLARAAVELAEQLTHRGVALAIAGQGEPRIIAASSSADRRLGGLPLSPQSAVARAMASSIPVVAAGGEDVFGPGPGVPERRRNERAGTAYPLLDGSIVVGALVVLGPPLEPDAPMLDDLSPLLTDLGPRIAAAQAVHEAERRAVVDPLTGLRNRREFERALGATNPRSHDPATLILVDLDHFKTLNDTHGHPAGDAALRHVARLLEAAVRDGDLVARIGGEEFAVWLPRTGLREGMEVAERVRRSIAEKPLKWGGVVYPLTTSCGIASAPELVGDVRNLPAAADAALYRAKELGRNRVEKAIAAR